MEQVLLQQATGDQALHIDLEERANRERRALSALLQSGGCDLVVHSRCQKYSSEIVLSGIAGVVSILYTSCIPAFICYTSAPELGRIPLVMLQSLATVGCLGFHFFFVREGLQKLCKAIETLVASRRCFETKTIVQESCIALWGILAASGAIFSVIYAQIDPEAQHLPPLPSGLAVAAAAMVTIPIEMAKVRCLLSHINLCGPVMNRICRRKVTEKTRMRMILTIDAARDFWRSASSSLRESICDTAMLREFSGTESQASLLYAIIQKANPKVDVDLPRQPLLYIGFCAAGLIFAFCCSGLTMQLTVLQTIALSSPFLGIEEARRQVFTWYDLIEDADLTSVGNFTRDPLIDMPTREPYTLAPFNASRSASMVMLAMSVSLINILQYGILSSKEINKIQYRFNHLGFSNNEVFMLSPSFFVLRNIAALSLAVGAGALCEGINLMIIPPEISGSLGWLFSRTGSALFSMAAMFTFSSNLMDSCYRFFIMHKGVRAEKVLVAGIHVLEKLKTALMHSINNLNDGAIAELSDCWYDPPEEADWLYEEPCGGVISMPNTDENWGVQEICER